MFPDKNIEAALIAMDDFDEMQTKAKQLVQIDKPAPGAETSALGACLMHTHDEANAQKEKKRKQKVLNQHQLAPTQSNTGQFSDSQRQERLNNQQRNDQKGYSKPNDNYQDTSGYYRGNNFRGSRGRGRGQDRGRRGRGGKPPWSNNNNNQSQSQGHLNIEDGEGATLTEVEDMVMTIHSNPIHTIKGIMISPKGNTHIWPHFPCLRHT